mmetsp:Transcript_16904/g.20643  ORF Transcript_16904/g.20643 Transcript_16904/m.20643 type:complete len:596 (-) Transcript_16904:443-2230(-)
MVRDEIIKKMENDDDHKSSDDMDDEQNSRNRGNKIEKLAYDDEQVALRSAFLSSGKDTDNENHEDDDADDAWLKKKNSNRSDDAFNGDTQNEFLTEMKTLSDSHNNNEEKSPLQDPKGEVEDGEEFLFDFIKNKRWIDHTLHNEQGNDNGDDVRNNDGNDSDTSLNILEKTDDFESRYNFRFEEANAANDNSGAAMSVVGYARASLSDTIRRKDESRKLKREERKKRKLAERKAKEETLKRLKNAKREEMEERIKQVKSVLSDKATEIPDGIVNEEMVAKIMEGDFDEDKFEELMSKMYNDDFYQEEDSDWKTDVDVKESLKKSDDKDIVTAVENGDNYFYEDDEEGEGYQEENEENKEEMYDDDYTGENYEETEEEKPLEKKLKDRMMDELYKLDYEDIIGDMPTRFKYREVVPSRYGLTPEEILFSRDTTLKQFVSLKRMAPYDEEGEYMPGTKKRKRFREMAKHDYEEIAEEDANILESANEVENASKKKRRRQKKGKKKDKNDAKPEVKVTNDKKESSEKFSESVGEDSIQNISSNDTSKDCQKNGDIKKKKSRKKNGKKETKQKDVKSKKKKRKEPIDGVSDSRLASYGF